MPDGHAAVYCDEDVSVVLAAMLHARGFAVTTARDSGRLGRSDEQQLAFAAETSNVLLTHNRVDFEQLHRRRLPAELAGRVGRLLARLSPEDLVNQLFYV